MVQYFFAALQSLAAREDEGQGLVEYALIIALIAVVCIGALELIGTGVTGTLGKISGKL